MLIYFAPKSYLHPWQSDDMNLSGTLLHLGLDGLLLTHGGGDLLFGELLCDRLCCSGSFLLLVDSSSSVTGGFFFSTLLTISRLRFFSPGSALLLPSRRLRGPSLVSFSCNSPVDALATLAAVISSHPGDFVHGIPVNAQISLRPCWVLYSGAPLPPNPSPFRP